MVEVLSPGLYTSIQDKGRFGLRKLGVPVSGVMDQYSAHIANSLLGNHENAAVLEITFHGPRLRFHQKTAIAVVGAPAVLLLNNRIVSQGCAISIQPGDEIKMGAISTGARCYLAVSGGIKTPLKLNSHSQYLGITTKVKLEKGDWLKINEFDGQKIINRSRIQLDKNHFINTELMVYKAPEFDQLDNESIRKILSKKMVVNSNSNRMAYQFNQKLSIHCNEIMTCSVQPGTVQLTPDGQLIVLMRDCQSTGGYARIFQLSDEAINILSQKRPGSKIIFKLI